MRRLFWDIETSPNIVFSWRVGGKVRLNHDSIIQERAVICICYKWEGEKKIHSLQWKDGDDSEILTSFAAIAEEADEMVAHNGDRFDMPWFNARMNLNGLRPLPHGKTFDTLKIARRYFRFNSNRLDYLGHVLLGEGKIRTEFDLWKDITLNYNEKSTKKMVDYCKKDVSLLERVWGKLVDYARPSVHAAVVNTGDPSKRWMCPYCASGDVKTSKTVTTSVGMVQKQMQCKCCGRYYTISRSAHRYYLESLERYP
jgi:hypothetical protein